LDLENRGYLPLKTECNNIYNPNIEGDDDASWLLIPKSGSKETESTSNVHWIFQNVERKAVRRQIHDVSVSCNDSHLPSNSLVHQNPKIITQERASNAQGPCGGNDKELAREKQNNRDIFGERFGQKRHSGLIYKCLMIQGVAKDSKGKDKKCEKVAAMMRVVVE